MPPDNRGTGLLSSFLERLRIRRIIVTHPDGDHADGPFAQLTIADDEETPIARVRPADPEVARLVDEADRILADSVVEQVMSDDLIREATELLAGMKRREAAATTGRQAARALDLWAVLLPSRIVNEELGDYLEDIYCRCAAGQRWCVYLRVAAAIFWTGLNAVGYAMKAVGRRRAG